MKKKKLLSLLLASSLTLALAACSGGTGSGTEGSKPPASTGGSESDTKIAVLLSGPPTDGGFCQSAAEATTYVAEKNGFQSTMAEVSDAQSIKENAEELAADGYKIIYGHGGQFATPFAEIAGDYPETWFLTTGGEAVGENQFPLCVSTEQGAYVCGVLAAHMTKSNTIAWLVGGDYPAYTKAVYGFQLGAQSVNPDIKVLTSVLSDSNATEAYESTMSQIKSGADVIFCNGDEGNLGSMKAVKENPGVYAFGVFGDYSSSAPEQVLLNSIPNYKEAFNTAATKIMSGAITDPEVMFLGLADGAVDLVWNEAAKANLPQEAVDAVEDTQAKIESGEIVVPNEYEITKLFEK